MRTSKISEFNASKQMPMIRAGKIAGAAIMLGGALIAFEVNSAMAQDGAYTSPSSTSPSYIAPSSNFGIELEVGGGGEYSPKYQGSDSYKFSAYPIAKIKRFKLGNFEVGGPEYSGLSLYPNVRFRDKRSASDDHDLRGLPTVDSAMEMGLGVKYRQDSYDLFAQGRKGVSGHSGWVGELGMDLKFEPASSGWSFKLGPRASFADAKFTDEYFGIKRVTDHFHHKYKPGGGLKTWGAAASARYEFASNWAWESSIEYDRLTKNAGDSPLVQNKDQFIVRSGLSYRFSYGFGDQDQTR